MTLADAIEVQERFEDGRPVSPIDLTEATDIIFSNAVAMYRALEFYADRDNYGIWTDASNNCPTNNVTFNDGYNARKAIGVDSE